MISWHTRTMLTRSTVVTWPLTVSDNSAVPMPLQAVTLAETSRIVVSPLVADNSNKQISSKTPPTALLIGPGAQFTTHCQIAAYQCTGASWNQLDPINSALGQCSTAQKQCPV